MTTREQQIADLRHYHHQQGKAHSLACPPTGSIGTLETIGYTEPEAAQRVADYLAQSQTHILVDIRFSPRSRYYYHWNRAALHAVYGPQYKHVPGLGNVNYNHPGEPIRIAEPCNEIPRLIDTLRKGYSLLLLCGCKHYDTCHRKQVADLVTDALRHLEQEVQA